MFDTSETSSPPSSAGWIARLLTWAGVVLLLVGALLAGPSLSPYVASRLYPPPTTPLPSDTPAGGRSSGEETPTAGLSALASLPLADEEAEPTVAVTDTPLSPTPTPIGYPPTQVAIPSVGVDAAVVLTTWEEQETGGDGQSAWIVPEAELAGWHEGSAPLGHPGNTVINGHNWPENAVFRDLYKAELGDSVILYSGNRSFSYEIAEVLVLPEAGQPLEVRQENARYIEHTDDERVTLVTCHPYGSLRNRLIVIARPVEPTEPGSDR